MFDIKHWLLGLVAALVSGAANAVILLVADPLTFNLHEGFSKLITVVTLNALVSVSLYLKQSPIPAEETPKS